MYWHYVAAFTLGYRQHLATDTVVGSLTVDIPQQAYRTRSHDVSCTISRGKSTQRPVPLNCVDDVRNYYSTETPKPISSFAGPGNLLATPMPVGVYHITVRRVLPLVPQGDFVSSHGDSLQSVSLPPVLREEVVAAPQKEPSPVAFFKVVLPAQWSRKTMP
ncbi:hypothetical protein DICA3_C14554 [Diutina catenulata]